MRKIALHLKVKFSILFDVTNRWGKNELCQKDADVCEELCQEMEITAINLCNVLK